MPIFDSTLTSVLNPLIFLCQLQSNRLKKTHDFNVAWLRDLATHWNIIWRFFLGLFRWTAASLSDQKTPPSPHSQTPQSVASRKQLNCHAWNYSHFSFISLSDDSWHLEASSEMPLRKRSRLDAVMEGVCFEVFKYLSAIGGSTWTKWRS